jgi:hypothetical protein
LAFFVGAGISKTVETTNSKLPDWSELIAEIRSEINDKNEQDYLKIAQLYYITFGEHKYHNTIKKYFPETIEPSIIHEMIFDLNPQIIITTNWDNILDNSIKKQGYLYDIICSDAELVRSSLPKKLIKMHGDFNHHNFVFKEDDYVGYSDNFPLIENYIKGILTTHTVVFLGYSYNDIDIKHIINWIQNRSACRPPMFITVFDDNQSQKKYLNNYGITTLILKDETITLPNTYSSYTKRIHCFLGNLNAKGAGYKMSTNEDIINFVYNKVIVFDDLQNILLSQIESVLTNCKIMFSNGFPALMFFSNFPSTHLNDDIISIYNKFIEIINDIKENDFLEIINEKKKLGKIFEIFYRAGIMGIMLNNKLEDVNKILNFNSCFSGNESDFFKNILHFNFCNIPAYSVDSIIDKMNRAFIFYQQEQYDKIIPILDEIISECRIEKRWILLFIAMLNKNIILQHLKYYLFRHEYDSLKEFDLYEEYEKLPEEIKTVVKPIYDFLEFNDLYRLFFLITRDLAAKEGYINTKRSGGMVFGTDGGKNYMQQENLLRFVIGNKIMIENYV